MVMTSLTPSFVLWAICSDRSLIEREGWRRWGRRGESWVGHQRKSDARMAEGKKEKKRKKSTRCCNNVVVT